MGMIVCDPLSFSIYLPAEQMAIHGYYDFCGVMNYVNSWRLTQDFN